MKKLTTVIAIANNKGGTGKTSTACNLADGLAKKLMGPDGRPTGGVLIIDLDPQGNVADFFGARSVVYDGIRNPDGKCISQLLTGRSSFRDSLVSLNRPKAGLNRPNLYMIPAGRELELVAEELLIRDTLTRRSPGRGDIPLENVLVERLAPADGTFDYIILDCPPKLDILKIPVYRYADQVIVPTKTDFLSVAGTAEHTADLDNLIRSNTVTTQISFIVPTMVRDSQVSDREMTADLVRTYGRRMMADPIPLSVKVKESPGAGGRSIFEYDARSAPALAYASLVEKVANYG